MCMYVCVFVCEYECWLSIDPIIIVDVGHQIWEHHIKYINADEISVLCFYIIYIDLFLFYCLTQRVC